MEKAKKVAVPVLHAVKDWFVDYDYSEIGGVALVSTVSMLDTANAIVKKATAVSNDDEGYEPFSAEWKMAMQASLVQIALRSYTLHKQIQNNLETLKAVLPYLPQLIQSKYTVEKKRMASKSQSEVLAMFLKASIRISQLVTEAVGHMMDVATKLAMSGISEVAQSKLVMKVVQKYPSLALLAQSLIEWYQLMVQFSGVLWKAGLWVFPSVAFLTSAKFFVAPSFVPIALRTQFWRLWKFLMLLQHSLQWRRVYLSAL